MLFEITTLEKMISDAHSLTIVLILDFLYNSVNLKKIMRQGWIDKLSIMHPESVADHTFSMAVIGMVLSDLEGYDTEKILKMIILHDLAESIIGDITPEQKERTEKLNLENNTMLRILSLLPENIKNQYETIWTEFQNHESQESKFVHEIDKLEMALQAKIYSKEIDPSEKIIPFVNYAKEGIKDPNILKLFNQIYSK